jgi:hypothetical protein
MNKFHDLLSELDTLKLSKQKYVIVGSGPLGIRGIREPNDLDILVNDDLWDELSATYGVLNKDGSKVIKISDSVEALGSKTFLNESSVNPTTEEQIKDAEFIEEYPFQSIKHFKYFKEMSGRQKDLQDLTLLQKWTDQK